MEFWGFKEYNFYVSVNQSDSLIKTFIPDNRGNLKLTEVLKQAQYRPLSLAEQVSILFAANKGILDDVDTKNISKFKVEWFKYLGAQAKDLEAKLLTGDKLSDADETALVDHLNKFKTNFFKP